MEKLVVLTKGENMKETVFQTVTIEKLNVDKSFALLGLKPIGGHTRDWVMNLTEWLNLNKPVPGDVLYLRFTLPPEEEAYQLKKSELS